MKKFIKENLINEGGNAFPNVRSITNDELIGTYKILQDEIIPNVIGKVYADNIFPIGSFNKKPIGEKYGDIDLVFYKKDWTKDYLLDFSKKFVEAGYSTNPMIGFSQVSIAIPILGDESNGFVQVDFMFSKDKEWSKFVYDAPNMRKGESKYKAVYAKMLIQACISESYKKTTKKTTSGEVEEYSLLTLRNDSGVFEVIKSYMGKKGLTKTPKIISDKLITRNPIETIQIALGEEYTDTTLIRSFEKIWEIINKSDFIHKDKLNEIISKYKYYLDQAGLPYPKEIK